MIHCVGGLGRSGAVAAGYLKYRGLSTDEAVAEVRRARSPEAIESEEQMNFVRTYPDGN
jgi:protein-tyrosine phosphatase